FTFFFSSRRRHTRSKRDWSSDVCSSDLEQIEPKWQKYWQKHKTFKTPENHDKPKYYVLDMFPYPSGSGLHVGHPEGYTATDILRSEERRVGKECRARRGSESRQKKMTG